MQSIYGDFFVPVQWLKELLNHYFIAFVIDLKTFGGEELRFSLLSHLAMTALNTYIYITALVLQLIVAKHNKIGVLNKI